jgi:hypothetical protein
LGGAFGGGVELLWGRYRGGCKGVGLLGVLVVESRAAKVVC